MADHDIPSRLQYTAHDEWVEKNDDHVRIGVTDFAQDQLGDIVYVELPNPGDTVIHNEAFGVIESVKAVSDLFAPLSGQVLAVNGELADRPEVINEDCYGAGWMLDIQASDEADFDALLDAESYAKSVEERSE